MEHTSSRLHDHKKKFSYAFFMKDVKHDDEMGIFLSLSELEENFLLVTRGHRSAHGIS